MQTLTQLNLTYLEQQVLDTIKDAYNAVYIKPLKVHVEQISPTLNYYELQLFLNEEYRDPYVIATQCATDQDFLSFLYKELKQSELIRRKQFGLILYGND